MSRRQGSPTSPNEERIQSPLPARRSRRRHTDRLLLERLYGALMLPAIRTPKKLRSATARRWRVRLSLHASRPSSRRRRPWFRFQQHVDGPLHRSAKQEPAQAVARRRPGVALLAGRRTPLCATARESLCPTNPRWPRRQRQRQKM